MMAWLEQHEFLLAAFIVAARIIDVSMGTMRTICVVRGYRLVAAVLGFCEVIVWIVAVSGVLAQPTLVKVVAYGVGFSLGNFCGVALEQKLALGKQLILLISQGRTHSVAFALRLAEFGVTEIAAFGHEGDVALAMTVVPRRRTQAVIDLARKTDPKVFIAVQDVRYNPLVRSDTSVPFTGWRTMFKKK